MLTFDAHLDLAMNALDYNRDLRQPLAAIRARERGQRDKKDRGRSVVCFPEMRKGGVGLCVATQLGRYVKPSNPLHGWHSPEQAWAHTQGHLAWYRLMEEAGELTPITDLASLEASVATWSGNPPDDAPIGYILSLEGADSLVTPAFLERSYASGLRAVGLSHYGPGTYAQGTDATGGLGPRGRELLKEMERLGVILDATHLCEDSFWEALEHFNGPVWASHHNCHALVPHNRQLTDRQILALIERGAVIGSALDAWMIVPNWNRGFTTPESANLTLDRLVDHMDHICQLAGNANHIGIGSDLDGGFGEEQTPREVRSIADLSRLPALLSTRGYSESDITKVQHGNFLRFLRTAWA